MLERSVTPDFALVHAAKGDRYGNLVFHAAAMNFNPLAAMAGDLTRALAPGGTAVLSGLLARQAPLVLAAHRARRLVLRRRITIDGWTTLVLARSGAPVWVKRA